MARPACRGPWVVRAANIDFGKHHFAQSARRGRGRANPDPEDPPHHARRTVTARATLRILAVPKAFSGVQPSLTVGSQKLSPRHAP